MCYPVFMIDAGFQTPFSCGFAGEAAEKLPTYRILYLNQFVEINCR